VNSGISAEGDPSHDFIMAPPKSLRGLPGDRRDRGRAALRDWFLDRVRTHTQLRAELAAVAQFALVTDLDIAGARGSAQAAMRVI